MPKIRVVLYGAVALLLLLLVFCSIAVWYIGLHDRGISGDFDAKAIAEAETRMWQAYYTGDGETLGLEMVVLLREQFGLSLKSAYEVVQPMARGAMTFARAQGDYESKALPHIEQSYRRIAQACGKESEWDAKALAQKELDWWAARRTPGQDSPEQVGAIIAELYTMLYGETNDQIEKAGLLRAQAATLRDEGGANADWPQVQDLLVTSYTALLEGIQ